MKITNVEDVVAFLKEKLHRAEQEILELDELNSYGAGHEYGELTAYTSILDYIENGEE